MKPIGHITIPAQYQSAVQRASQMMMVPMKDLPPKALAYARFMCRKYGGCGEVFMTAYAGYAQKVEGLPCSDSLYTVSEIDWDEFEKGYPAQ
jgi:hypothetical protein